MYAIFYRGRHIVSGSYIACLAIVFKRFPSAMIHSGSVAIVNLDNMELSS